MNIQQPKIDLKNRFELYLEGIQVDFTSINISETEGGIPAASITFPSNYGVLRILAGTVVQVFGYVAREDKTYLLFEGEVTEINYQKSEATKVVVLKAISLLGSMVKAKFRPADALVTQDRKDADNIQAGESIIYNNGGQDSTPGQTTVEDLPKIENTDDKILSGKNKDIGLSAVFGLTDEFRKMLADDKPGGKGDFIPMLQEFNTYFEHNDLFYGLRSLAYKFGRTTFASPNPDLLNKIKIDLFFEAMNKVQSAGLSDIYSEAPYTLMQVLVEFQRYLHYNFISPASYTACRPFYIKGQTNYPEPLRMIYMPRLETGPPALSNIIFPEQVSSFTYSRDMMSEPTRIIGKATTPLLDSAKSPVDFSPLMTYPDLELEPEKAAGKFTTEETYRGVNYKVLSYSNLHSDLITDKLTTTKDGKKSTKPEITEDDVKGEIGNIIKPFTYFDYLDMKYKSRLTSISTEWSPYRVIGLPGLILDNDGVSLLGTLNGITTNITAQGAATSRLSFRNTRLIHDEDFEKVVFSKVPDENYEGLEKHVIHDLTMDGMISTNQLLFYKDLYSFETIGRDVYTYIMHGALNKNKGFYKLIDEKEVFDYAKDKLDADKYQIEEHSRLDNSILHFILDEDGNINLEIPKEYNKKTELRNTYLLYKSVTALRKAYEAKKYKTVNNKQVYDMQQAYDYVHLLNKRNIITKENYFNFIGADPDRKKQTDDAHDAVEIFRDGPIQLRETIINYANSQYVNVITTQIADKLTSKSRLTSLNQELKDLHYSNENTFDEYINSYIKNVAPYAARSLAAEVLRDDWEKIEKLLKEKEQLSKTLKQVQEEPESLNTDSFVANLYKPYNITRRMHVILGLKDIQDVLVNNKQSKLKVTK